MFGFGNVGSRCRFPEGSYGLKICALMELWSASIKTVNQRGNGMLLSLIVLPTISLVIVLDSFLRTSHVVENVALESFTRSDSARIHRKVSAVYRETFQFLHKGQKMHIT